MRPGFLTYILLLAAIACSSLLKAGSLPAHDSLKAEPVRIEKTVEESVFEDASYNYEQDRTSVSNVFSDFFEWLIRKLFGDFNAENVSAFWNIVKIVFILLFIGGLVYLAMKSKFGRLFKGDSNRTPIFRDVTENIEGLDIDRLIRDALEAGDYKVAFRYTFLKSLQLMNNKELIDWKPHKTNFEYYMEFRAEKIRPLFRDLYIGFEYVWYGDAVINKEVYERYSNEFKNFNTQLGA